MVGQILQTNQHALGLDGIRTDSGKRICRPLRNHSATWPLIGNPYRSKRWASTAGEGRARGTWGRIKRCLM
jgi:hypothetical protein